jgi:hypothetical protein
MVKSLTARGIKMRKLIVVAVVLGLSQFWSNGTNAANLLERDGAYEVNWSTGKVRFYGVGQWAKNEDSMRAAEQRAWADGLQLAERNLPIILSNRLGHGHKITNEKLSKLAQATVSVSTTYFGDHRVKVILEVPLEKILPQLVAAIDQNISNIKSSALVIQLPQGSKPSAIVRIVDESGRELANSAALAGAGAPVVRWYKTDAPSIRSASGEDFPVISGVSKERGVIQISSAAWKPGFQSALASGAAAIVVR